MSRNVVVLLENREGRVMVEKFCRENGFDFSAFEELIKAEIEQSGKQKKKGLWDDFDNILDHIKIDD